MSAFLSLALMLVVVAMTQAMKGFDISLQMCNNAFYNDNYWSCFKQNGFGFAVIQAAQGGNGNTAQIANCVKSAHNQGFAVSVYGWFCPNCRNQSNAYQSAYNAVMNMKNQGIYPGTHYTYFYIDVEECDPDDDCYSKDHNVNRQYILDLVKGVQDAGASAGIYASSYEWNLLMGSASWSDPRLTALPLWYANWNNKADMSGFSSFGGWSSPHMHQYADSCSVCYNVDQDFIY